MGNEYHVAITGNDKASGSATDPFRTISHAAQIADIGDRVVVHEGTYREWVKPAKGGRSTVERITYEAAPGERPVIKGSERITDWEPLGNGVWKATIDNAIFGDYNPYAEVLGGDWFIFPWEYNVHAGDVYLNGKSLYEATKKEDVFAPERRIHGFIPFWMKVPETIQDPDFTIYQWFAEVGEETTEIWANFHDANPNEELAEINVRKCCFYPEKTGRNYITVRGFEMAQAASPWTPPTADQPGMLGVNWSKGWIIEDNILHDAKCSAVSIGKEASTGHNLCTITRRKPGYRYQMEAVFLALKIGWSKENIGSHIIRNNTIYDCGQNGIVGHMGCVFSEIYNNHIYNIAVKHEFFGFEIGGIKLHAAIDVKIENNRIHHCTLGTWLDWQAQGTRVSRNIYYANDRDLMIEVTHGPCLVDNNIFASRFNIENFAQGTAYAQNLFLGASRRVTVLDRATPYHFPHSTDVAGFSVVFGGDERFYNNIFVGGSNHVDSDEYCGTSTYDEHPSSYEEYQKRMDELGRGDHDIFQKVSQPVYMNGNIYMKDAKAFGAEKDFILASDFDPSAGIIEKDGRLALQITMPAEAAGFTSDLVSTTSLGSVRIVDGIYDDPEGKEIVLDTDLVGGKRAGRAAPGPIEGLVPGKNVVYLN